MQMASLTPSKKYREQVLKLMNCSTKYYCALLVSHLVMLHNSSRIVNGSPNLYISLQNRKVILVANLNDPIQFSKPFHVKLIEIILNQSWPIMVVYYDETEVRS